MDSHLIATPEQHAHELEALALIQHPVVKEACIDTRDLLDGHGIEMLHQARL